MTREEIMDIHFADATNPDAAPEETMTDKAWANGLRIIRNMDGVRERFADGRCVYTSYCVSASKRKEMCAQSGKKIHERAEMRKAKDAVRIADIRQEALRNKMVNIDAPLTDEHRKLIVEALTDEMYQQLERTRAALNKRFSNVLYRMTPNRLRISYKMYPESFKNAPPFTYRASEEYGDGAVFDVSPEHTPYYIEQGTEQKTISLFWGGPFLNRIDRQVAAYAAMKKRFTDSEAKYASQLLKISTYFQLVKHKPYWYDALMRKLINK